MGSPFPRCLSLALVAGVIFLDQASKAWMEVLLSEGRPPLRVTAFFNLVLVYNRGVSFGLLGGWKLPALVLVLLSVFLVSLLFFWLRRQEGTLLPWAGGLIGGGALGNAIDRLPRPGVVDFLDFHWAGYHWPAFNLADSAIVVGVGLILADSLFAGELRRKRK